MLILAVELENVKSYDKATVEFLPGVNAIVGHNGAGKSTLLEAIGFVLFDSLPYKQSDFMRAGAKSASAAVTFVSSLDDRPYQVRRRIGTGAHYYVFDPQLDLRVCEGKADVQRFLRLHLGVEEATDLPALFRDAVGVPQGMLTAAFLLVESARGDVFDALLKVRDYERAWDKLREPITWLRSRRATLAADISGMEGRLARLPVLQTAVVARSATLATTQSDLTAADDELSQAQLRRAELETVREQLTGLEAQVAQAGERFAGVQSRLVSAEQALTDAQEAARIVARNQADAQRFAAAQIEKNELDLKLRRRGEVDAQRAAAELAVATCTAQARGLERELATIVQAEAVMAGLSAAVSEQAELDQALTDARQQQARLDDARRAVAQSEAQVTRLTSQFTELQQALARVEVVEEERGAVDRQMDALREQIEQCRDNMSRHESRADALKEQTSRLEDVSTAFCPVCEQPLTDEHRSDLLDRNSAQLDAMRAKYKSLKSTKKMHELALADQEARAKQLQGELLTLPRAQEVDALAAELRRAQEAHRAAQAQAEQLSAAPGQVEVIARRLQALDDPQQRHAVAAAQARRRSQVEQQQGELARQMAGDEATLASALAALVEFAGLDERLDAVTAELARSSAAHQSVLTNLRTAESLPAREAEVRGLAEDLEHRAAALARLKTEHAEVCAAFDAQRYAQVMSRAADLQTQIGGLQKQLSMLQTDQERDHAEIAALQEIAQALEESQTRRAKLEDQEHVLEKIRATLREAGPHMRAALIQQISDGAHQFFGEIMQDFSRRLIWNSDYSVALEVDGHLRQFAQLSGGEQMCAALSVRLALLREMSAIDVAFFDEPTANLDEMRREALARQILAVRGFRQIFVISHDDTFEQATQNLVRVERQNGISRVLEAANRA